MASFKEDEDRLGEDVSSREPHNFGSNDGTDTIASKGSTDAYISSSMKNLNAGNDDRKRHNTGSITTATNHIDNGGFTHPQHDMSAPEGKTSGPDSASGVTTATNHTDDSGFTSPGEDMSKRRSSASQDL